MSYAYVFRQLGLLLLVLSAFLLAAGACAAIFWRDDGTRAVWALLVSAATGGLGGLVMVVLTRGVTSHLGRREALLLVALSWLIGAALAALPFLLWAHLSHHGGLVAADHPFLHVVDCYFESMSGLTTTGATVLGALGSDIESIPRGLLLWRSLTQWLGGIGIVVLFVAVLPSLGVGGKKLFRVEAPGPAPEGLQPQIRETARTLLLIYLSLTFLEIVLLTLAGMTLFDAVNHTFTTLATGGFSTRNASTGAYYAPGAPGNGTAIGIIIVLFMVLAGLNFGLFHQVLRGRAMAVLKDTELRLYLVLLGVGSCLVFAALAGSPSVSMTTPGTVIAPVPDSVAVREAVFTVVSVQTTTGFCTSDFNGWPFVAHAVLIALMFVGGCSGSTAGGIKVIRLWIAFKVMISEIERVFRPNVIRPVKLGSGTIDRELKLGTLAYVLGIVIIFALGSFLVMLFEDGAVDYTTAATASVATLCTIGPGLGDVGAVGHYGDLTRASKAVLSLLMVIGRLEVFAIIVLFNVRFWRGD